MTYKRHTIAEDWKKYADQVMPKDVSAIQMKECRRVWFAAHYQALQHVIELSQSEDAKEGKELGRLLSECHNFYEAIKGGVA